MLHRFISIVRRHSALLNFLRNLGQLARGRRVDPAAWLILDGELRFGRGATVSRAVRLTVPADSLLVLGEQCWLNHHVEVEVLGRIVIGANTSLQRGCTLIGDIEIGRGCLFAPNVFVSSGRHYFDLHPALPIRAQDAAVEADPALRARHSRPVRIGDDCWLGANVVVLPGVTIGRGVVVGANSVVVRDVLPYNVVSGVPAQVLRSRLEFTPPRELDGRCEQHLPYFYSGFELGTPLPPVADGDFTLALDLAAASSVTLTLRGVGANPIEVSSGAVRALVAADREVDVEIPVGSRSAGDWLNVQLPAGGRVLVLKARVAGAVARPVDAARSETVP